MFGIGKKYEVTAETVPNNTQKVLKAIHEHRKGKKFGER